MIATKLSDKLILIGGTRYASEMKKSVFGILNYLLPANAVMPIRVLVLAQAVIDQTILDPRSTWHNKDEYDATSSKLVQLFIYNFAEFDAFVDEGVRQAVPVAA